MEFESAERAALRFDCTVRAVQKWAKDGKIPYAYKDGRDWKIPTTAVRPDRAHIIPRWLVNEPLPLIHAYEPGTARQYIDHIENADDREMAECEYAYFTGDLKRSAAIATPYLTSNNPILRSTAAMFCVFSYMGLGDLRSAHAPGTLLRNEYTECLIADTDEEIRAVNLLLSQILRMQLDLPTEDLPQMHKHLRYLDGGLRLIACYVAAYRAYHDKQYEKALGIVETALNLNVDCYPLAFVYLHLIEAIAHINLLHAEDALNAMENAWNMAEADGFIMPFVEHYSLLQGLIERQFKKTHPQEYKRITAAAKQYNNAWYRLYNAHNEASVTGELTHTEFTVAMLYSRNWRVKEIAAHMELSERTVMNYIAVIYEKLQINGKKDLEKYML